MKMKKALAACACAAVLVCGSVAATMAYLTSQDSVTNTFTVGNVAITLDEKDVDGSKTDVTTEGRDKANKYHLIPGSTYVKDPIVHVDKGSEKCWLFVKVVNGIADVETTEEGATIVEQMAANGWALVESQSEIWAYEEVVTGGTNGTDVPVFGTFKIAGTATNGELAKLEAAGAKIVVTAYAIQAENFETAAKALAAAPFPTA